MSRSLLLAGLLLSLATARAATVLPASTHNSAIGLSVISVTAQSSYGSAHASPGKQFVVLATEWENRIDPKLALERGLATAYLIEDLAQHLFLVMDGQWLGTLRGGLRGSDQHASLAGVSLGKSGAKLGGDIVYELPAGIGQSLDLRFYDDTTGYMKLALAGPAPEPKALFPLQKNEIAEVGVFAVENPAKGVVASPGFRAVAVDLRVRSLWLVDGEAPGYDASQPPGTIIKHVNLLDWTETQKYIHVVADGDYACPLAENSGFGDSPRFIPEFFSGDRLVFQVPADAQSLELFCEMPHAAAPGGGTIDLAPMIFPLSGTAPKPVERPPLLAIQDEMFAINVTSARRTTSLAGEAAGDGQQFLVLALTVANRGKTGEFFQPREQLFLLDAEGKEVPPDDLSARIPHRAEDQVHLPAESHRRFEIVYRLDAAVKSPQLSFHGGSFMQAYQLPWSQ